MSVALDYAQVLRLMGGFDWGHWIMARKWNNSKGN